MQYDQLISSGLKKHHEALFRGYISRKIDAEIVPYSGRFGSGYKALRPNSRSTYYSIVEYWVK